MKLLKRNPAKFETLDLYRALAQQEGYTFTDPDSSANFLNRLGDEFNKAKNNPITLQGVRAQAMFEYVAASLGKCAVIKSEDAGGIHAEDTDIKIPDLRILLIDGQEFFVEVKNFYQQGNPFADYKLKKKYVDGLRKYGSLFKRDVKLAIYWVGWNIWTLISLDKVNCLDNKYVVSFEEAFKYNEMSILGDYMVGTLAPLRLRVLTDPNSPRQVDNDEQATFSIGGLELYCADHKITEPLERNIAFFLMLYGNWPSEGGEAEIVNQELIAFEFISEPVEPVEEQGPQIIASMSGMISRRFISLTSDGMAIERLSPNTDRSELGINIPDDYKGNALPLLRLIVQPHENK